MKRFASCHPAAAFLFFAVVIGSTMFCLHPVLTPLSLLFALGTAAVLCPRRTLLQCGTLALILPPLSAALNALFSHAGVTVLWYLPSGNPLTRESLLYGAFAGGMLAAVLVWFAAFHVVMTSDKLLWLFSRLAPALSLLLSMTLRFVPRFRTQFAETAAAQRAVGRGGGEDSRLRRVQNGAAVFAAMTTRSLEGSIDTADAMRARGYGLPHRTAFSIFRLRAADTVLLCAVFVLAACLVGFSAGGALHASFYPVFTVAHGAAAWLAYAAYALLCALPLFFGLSEVKTWRS